MACPTCSHALTGIGYGMFHCPRCGTLVNSPVNGAVFVSALVERCRRFETMERADLLIEWKKLGIAESIWPEEKRA